MAEARNTGSLPVPNVQALAEACNGPGGQQVPERYFVDDACSEAEKVVVADSASAIPIIDLRRLLDPRSSPQECAKLASACHDWGFFQLINHGLPDEVIGNLMRDVAEFLKLTLEAKKEWSKQPDSVESYGQAFVVPEDQKLDWADMLYLVLQYPTESRDLRFWTTLPASFRHSVDDFSSATRELAYVLLELMAKGTGADPALLRGVFQGQEARQGMRVNNYPPSKQADRVLGLLPHSDACGLTLLLQMNHDVHGLQVKKDGQWFPLHTLHGAFIVNVGDVLEVLSNGKFRSVEHRAVIHPTKERISVALFHYPCQDLMLAPLPELVRKGEKVWYGSMSFRDYLKQVYAAKLDGRKHLEGLKVGLASSYNIYGSRINVIHDNDYD